MPSGRASQQSSGSTDVDEPVSLVTELDSVMQEILVTERAYVADLTGLVMADLGRDCPLRTPLLRLQKLHTELLAALEAANSQLGPLCQAFLDCDFRVYAEYCASFPGALEWLRQIRAASSSPRLQRDQHQHQLQNQDLLMLHLRLPLEAHLLQPVQRIARYPLLLRRLAGAADGAAARPAAARAAARMTEAASETDERQRRQQQAERLLRAAVASSDSCAASSLTRWPGPLLLEAGFSAYGHRNPRRALLFGRALLLTKCRSNHHAATTDVESELSLRAVFWCDRLALMDSLPREPLAFRLLALDRPPSEAAEATLRADTAAQKRLWCGELRRLILDAIGGGCGSFDQDEKTPIDGACSRRRSVAPRRSRSDAGSRRRPGRPFEPCLAAYAQRLRVQDVVTEADVQPLLTALWGVGANLVGCGTGGSNFKRRDSLTAASNLVGSLLRRRGSGCSLTSSPRVLRRRATEDKAEKKSVPTFTLAPATEADDDEASEPVKLRSSSRQAPTVSEGLAGLIDSLPYADADERARLSMAAAAAAAAADVKEWRSTKDWSVENVFWKRALLDPPEKAAAVSAASRQPKTLQTQL